MRLVSFTVENYRSIKRAHKIQVGDQTILVGPNNEGKSNLIRALVTAMEILRSSRVVRVSGQTRTFVSRARSQSRYDWQRDFPQELQTSKPNGKSHITVEFELTPDEVGQFRSEIGSNLNGTLPLKISVGAIGDPEVTLVKQGPGAKTLNQKSPRIAWFVSQRINFEHIPAMRTAGAAQAIVNGMVERELATLEKDPEFQEALSAISLLQQPILDRLSENIKRTLVQFLPTVADVKVQIPVEERSRALRAACQIVVDDGTATLLEHKGDGVQSLAALGIMRHASLTSSISPETIIAIEEPESHLHSGAIHELKAVLQELSEVHQVLITTHNPLFIDRSALRNNIVVRGSQARAARDIGELRDALGVRASDNLRQAELVLIVEGECDRVSVSALLVNQSASLADAISNGMLVIDTLGGASNLSYKAGMLLSALCQVHCFLDDDDAGRVAFEKARAEGQLRDSDANWVICEGMRDAEFEDLLDPTLYSEVVEREFGAKLSGSSFRNNKKWSERMGATFRRDGRGWNARIERDVKTRVAELVALEPESALLGARRSSFDGLVGALEGRLAMIATGATGR